MNSFSNIRVLPVVLVAIAGLAVLKIASLAIDGSYVFDAEPVAVKSSWARDNFGFPSNNQPPMAGSRIDGDITGSVSAKKEEPKPDVKPPEMTKPPEGLVTIPEQGQAVSPSERALLERLQARRQELDVRAREIDIRESLLKAAEKRIEGRVEELKGVESRIATATDQKASDDGARFKGIVTMYEGMKPKDAAKVFDRLEMAVLFEIASQIAPRKMSDILGLMSPESAERLTVELARRASGDKSNAMVELPKIEGRPTPR